MVSGVRCPVSGLRCPVSGVPSPEPFERKKLPLPRGLEHFLNIKKGARFPPKPLKSLFLNLIRGCEFSPFSRVQILLKIENSAVKAKT